MVRMLCSVSGTWPEARPTGLAVFDLRCQYIFLYVAREAEQERQQNEQYDRQTAVLNR